VFSLLILIQYAANAFAADHLSQIAWQLDQLELSAYAQNNEGGINSKDYLNRVAEGSGNVDAQGNFSIEVLRAALKSNYGLELPNVRQEDVMTAFGDVTDLEGFICNKVSFSPPIFFAVRTRYCFPGFLTCLIIAVVTNT
jgi:Josephin